jgi:hypothetical protein
MATGEAPPMAPAAWKATGAMQPLLMKRTAPTALNANPFLKETPMSCFSLLTRF